jgi:hypothetical protein
MGRYVSNPLSAASADDYFAITPSNTVDFTHSVRGIYVGATGDVVAVTEGGTAVTFVAAQAGSVLPIRAVRVNATNTTATSLVGLY